jgi:hypothetical protein
MRRILPLLLIICLAMSACSEVPPLIQEIQSPDISLVVTATLPLFKAPTNTPTPTAVSGQNLFLTATPTISLTATLTPTLTSSPVLTTPALPTRPALLPTRAPEKSRFFRRDKSSEPCG